MFLFADSNINVDIGALLGAIGTASVALGGGIWKASQYMVDYLKNKDTDHHGETKALIETFRLDVNARDERHMKTVDSLIQISKDTTTAINELKTTVSILDQRVQDIGRPRPAFKAPPTEEAAH